MQRAFQQLHYCGVTCQRSQQSGPQLFPRSPLARKRFVASAVSSEAWDDVLVLQHRVSGALSTQKYIHKWATVLTLKNGEEDLESTVVEDLECDDLDTQLTVHSSRS